MSQLSLLPGGDRPATMRGRVYHGSTVSERALRVRQMSRYQIAFLRRYKRSDRVESTRTFPHERIVRFVTPNGESDRASDTVLGNLVRRGLPEASPEDTRWDRIVYRLTAAGQTLVDRMRSRV